MRTTLQPLAHIPALFARHYSTIAIMLAFALAALLTITTTPVSTQAGPRNLDELRRLGDLMTRTKVGPDNIPSLYRPEYIRVVDAALSLDRQDPVFIVNLPDGPRIYPQMIMVWHEVVNEIVGEEMFCITYSPVSGTVTAYNSRIGKTRHASFGVDGRLINGNTVLFDRDTRSLWSQMLGMSFDGTLAGKQLVRLPVYWTTWAIAQRALPQAKVLLSPHGSLRAYAKDPYGSYIRPGNYYDDDRLLYPIARLDKRMHPKKQIIGCDYEGSRSAVDVAHVRKEGVVNFTTGIIPLAAVLDHKLGIIRILDRRVWGKPVTLAYKDGKLIDTDSGTVWTTEGRAIEGGLKDAQLQEVPGIYAMWFAWSSFHPDTVTVPGEATALPQ